MRARLQSGALQRWERQAGGVINVEAEISRHKCPLLTTVVAPRQDPVFVLGHGGDGRTQDAIQGYD